MPPEQTPAATPSASQPAVAAPAPEIPGFGSGDTPPQATQNQDTPQGSGTPETPPSGQDGTEIPAAYRSEDGALDPAKALERLKAADEAQAARLEKYGDVPEGDYTLPEIELETGEKLTIDADNEFLKEALPELKEMGIGQKGAEKLLGLYAKATAADATKMVEAFNAQLKEQTDAEFASLGEKAQARFDSLVSNIDKALTTGDQKSEGAGKKLLSQIRTREAFEILEKILDPDAKGRAAGGQAAPAGGNDDPVVLLYGSRGTDKGAA